MNIRCLLVSVLMLSAGVLSALSVGETAPDYSAWKQGGQKVSLSQYKGKVVILKFWAKWCGPCRRSLPKSHKLQKKYGSRGLVVFAVGLSRNRQLDIAYLRDYGYSFRVQAYAGGWKTAPYKVRGIPYEVLIDRDGKVLWKGHFGMPESLVKKALAAGYNGNDSSTASGGPAPVTRLRATAHGSGKIRLSWNGASGAAYYYIFRRSTAGTVWKIRRSFETAFVDSGLATGQTYFYTIIACNKGGISGPSKVAAAIVRSGGSGGNTTSSLPDFSAKTISGRTVRLRDYTGKVVLIKFWAKWCGPCKRTLPKTNRLQKKYGSSGLVVFSVGLSRNKQQDADYLSTNGYRFKVQAYKGGWKTAPFKVKGIPYEILFGKDGKILWKGHFGLKESVIRKALGL